MARSWGHTGHMARFRRRRYDRYDPRYDYRYQPYQPRPVSGSCLRDACLLEGGCCLGEALGGNCLILTLLTWPHLITTLLAEVRALRRRQAVAGSRLTALLVAGIRTYQRDISPHRAPCCHFTPSCSEYAAQALQIHGARRGSWLALKRLGRCRPRTPTTADPVPPLTPS